MTNLHIFFFTKCQKCDSLGGFDCFVCLIGPVWDAPVFRLKKGKTRASDQN